MKRELLRKLPKVDYLLSHKELETKGKSTDYYTFLNSVKEGISFFREEILNDRIQDFTENDVIEKIKKVLEEKSLFNLRKVINGTGTIIHTNLGRSIFSEKMAEHMLEVLTSYNNLEYDLETGKRGSRYSHLEKLLCDATGAEGAVVVNNNAAAVVLCLNEFAKDREVVISRGELIEIGGSFRIPEIMKFAGTKLIETGTTNKTYIRDYENALSENTAVLMKVHTSNYRIKGFTYETEREDIVKLGKEKGLISIEDLGSGVLIDFSKYGVKKEATVQEVLKSGIDLVTFSGDKLLGGCQAGIILGKKHLIERLKKNQYLRTVRIDKMTTAVLEMLFRLYRNEKEAVENIPTLRYITENILEVKARAEKLSKLLSEKNILNKIIETEANIGGGSMPEETIKSFGIEILSSLKPTEIEKRLRIGRVGIIGRIENNKFILDMKTIDEKDILITAEMISAALGG